MGFANNGVARCIIVRFNSLPQPHQLLLNYGNLGFGFLLALFSLNIIVSRHYHYTVANSCPTV